MSQKRAYKLTRLQIMTIEAVISAGDRAEIVPVRDGVKILRARREEAKPPKETIQDLKSSL